jgi:hypothetical protein
MWRWAWPRRYSGVPFFGAVEPDAARLEAAPFDGGLLPILWSLLRNRGSHEQHDSENDPELYLHCNSPRNENSSVTHERPAAGGGSSASAMCVS